MPKSTIKEMTDLLQQMQQQLAVLTERIEKLEGTPVITEPVVAAAPAPPMPAQITEEEILAISAALGAYLGVRVHIRAIRLAGSRAWAQEGRVSIQASHRLHN